MKYKHSSNFSNHKNLMDMLVQTYNTFFENKIYCFRLSYFSYKLGKDILPFEKVCCFSILVMQTLQSFFPGHKTLK